MQYTDRRKWLALALLCVVQFMVVLDIAIVNVALPSIKIDLGFSQGDLQWVISAYALVFGGFLLLGGRAADMLGRRRVFLVGIVVFSVASLFAGLAWSETSLIGARALQGLGAAIITPAALSILSTTFVEGRERNIALGAWGAVGGFGAVAGVLLGGVLTDALSWEWIFFVNVPVGVAGFVLAPLLLHESRDARVKRFDLPGAVLVTSGLSGLVLAITEAGRHGWVSTQAVTVFALSAAAAGGLRRLGAAALRAADALRDPADPDRERGERGRLHPGDRVVLDVPDADPLHAAGAGLLRDEDGRGLPRGRRYGDPVVGGRRPAGDPGGGQAGPGGRDGACSPPAWRTSRRCRPTAPTCGDLLPGFLVIGVGIGFSFVPISIAALAGVRPAEAGLASGLINTSQQIGGALGIAALSTIATSRSGDALASGAVPSQALVDGFSSAFLAGTVVAAVGLLAALTLIRRGELEAAVPEAVDDEPMLDAA